MGNRFGPVLRSGPPIDTAAATIEWSDDMEQLALRRKTRRFVRGAQQHDPARHDVLRR